MYELHNELLVKEGAEPETLEEFYPIAEIILADFGQLDYELVDIDQIYMELYDTTKIDIAFQHLTEQQQVFIRQFWQSFSIGGHTGIQERFLKLWRRMPLLYRALKEKLKELGQRNYPTLYRNLAEGKAENGRFVERYKKTCFCRLQCLE